jgi:hypothetical protein
LQARFKNYPLVVEVRHASWITDEVLDTFAPLGIGFCNIDQPILPSIREADDPYDFLGGLCLVTRPELPELVLADSQRPRSLGPSLFAVRIGAVN